MVRDPAQGGLDLSSDPYAILAPVYDGPDHREVAESFFAAVEPIARRRPAGTWVLDLACGTGLVTEQLAAGCDVIGLDLSQPMLDIARNRCHRYRRRTRFIRGDLARFTVAEACAVACASGDIVNHFPSAAALRPIFKRIRGQLEPDGTFVFETLNRFCFEEYWADRTYHIEGDGGDLVMECDWDPTRRSGTARMIGYVRGADGGYRKQETVLREYLHSNGMLRDLLREAGFRRIRRQPWSPWGDQHLERSLDRNLWTAVR